MKSRRHTASQVVWLDCAPRGAVPLVTGANGHWGNTLVRAWAERGEQVLAGVRHPNGRSALSGVDCRLDCVNSVAAVGHDERTLTEQDWNDERDNAYYSSKIPSERLAWELSKRLGLDLRLVLPSAMIGPHAARLTDTMAFLDDVAHRRIPLDPGFHFNFVDVRDVAQGLIQAAEKGRSGERYIPANAHSSPMHDLIDAVTEVAPGYRLPPPAPCWLLMCLAKNQEWLAKLGGKPANLMVSHVRLFHQIRQAVSIAKARTELGYDPRPSAQALRETFALWLQRANQAAVHGRRGSSA